MTSNGLMNTCEEYREAIGADPSFDGGAGHLASCHSCQAYREEMHALNRRIGRALAISVPQLDLPELPDIDTSNVTSLPRRRLTAPAWLAVAASVTIAAFVGFSTFGTDVPADATLAEQILAHIEHEPYALHATNEPVSDERLARVVPASLATLDHSAGLITYAQSCIINGNKVPHLVMQGANGPVTILLMPEEAVNGVQEFDGEHTHGLIFPVGGGSVAIIGEAGESLEQVEERVKNSVKWDIQI